MGFDPNQFSVRYRKQIAQGQSLAEEVKPFQDHVAAVVNLTERLNTDESKLNNYEILIDPCPAPRMTRSDKWRGLRGSKLARRPIVQRYFTYRDTIQKAVGDMPTVPCEIVFRFVFRMPDSWSSKKCGEMLGKPHRQRPDVDNLVKAVLDSLFAEDGSVAKITASKVWGNYGSVQFAF